MLLDYLVFVWKLCEVAGALVCVAAAFAVLWVTLGVIEYAAPKAGA